LGIIGLTIYDLGHRFRVQDSGIRVPGPGDQRTSVIVGYGVME